MDLSARFTKLDYSPGNPGNPGNVLIFPQTLIHAAAARCTEINADDRIHSDCFFPQNFLSSILLRPWAWQHAATKNLGKLIVWTGIVHIVHSFV